ncbi:flagellar filament capping protein FliD [Modestobacter versicolor]|nr:flagellar filament capping protein FliD [Modestobacter versicolor]MBB3676507.1 flagellar hook-associated protein 2 [Modestobacter versicolor]
MSVSTGLISGIDYSTMITQLMQVEANPQSLLKNQLTATKSDATAYRAVNTRFETLRSAAAALTADTAWTAVKASSSNASVAASAGATAVGGSVTFTVKQLATAHSEISDQAWTGTDQAFGAGTFTFTPKGGTATAIAIPTTNAGGATLADAVAAINASDKGLTAAAVRVKDGEYRLQVTAKATGEKASFVVGDDTAWKTAVTGQDAKLTLGELALEVSSDTNTFTGLMADTSITVSKTGETATVGVTKDPSSVTTKVKALVDAANNMLQAVTDYTDPENDAALLKGDSTLRSLANKVLDVFSGGVGGVSASSLGVKLTRDGKLEFDSAAFTAKMASDPAAVKDLLTRKTIVSPGADLISGNADDVTSPLGFAAKLEALAKGASDTTTGSLVLLAKSQDALATDLQTRIDNWDTRLALRKSSLTAQFTAMEKALGTMQNQASWLSSQIAGLPSWSKSSK